MDIATVRGSGPSGRILHADVKALAGKAPVAAPLATASVAPLQAPSVAPVAHAVSASRESPAVSVVNCCQFIPLASSIQEVVRFAGSSFANTFLMSCGRLFVNTTPLSVMCMH